MLCGILFAVQCTGRSPEAFFEDLRHTREQGFAISVQEYEEGINAVAAPILDLNDQPIAAVAVAGPTYRLTRERMIEIGPLVVATAHDIAQEVAMAAHPEVHPVGDSLAATGARAWSVSASHCLGTISLGTWSSLDGQSDDGHTTPEFAKAAVEALEAMKSK